MQWLPQQNVDGRPPRRQRCSVLLRGLGLLLIVHVLSLLLHGFALMNGYRTSLEIAASAAALRTGLAKGFKAVAPVPSWLLAAVEDVDPGLATTEVHEAVLTPPLDPATLQHAAGAKAVLEEIPATHLSFASFGSSLTVADLIDASHQCLDLGPWPCLEAECEGPQRSCSDMEPMCALGLLELFPASPAARIVPPLWNLSHACPQTCGVRPQSDRCPLQIPTWLIMAHRRSLGPDTHLRGSDTHLPGSYAHLRGSYPHLWGSSPRFQHARLPNGAAQGRAEARRLKPAGERPAGEKPAGEKPAGEPATLAQGSTMEATPKAEAAPVQGTEPLQPDASLALEQDASLAYAANKVWGAVREAKIPEGEDAHYRAPMNLKGYEHMVDASSWRPEARRKAGCVRTFHTGVRSDMLQTVVPLFRKLGLCRSKRELSKAEQRKNGSATAPDVLWTISWVDIHSFFRRTIAKGAIVNSVPGLTAQVGMKTSLARLHVSCMQRAGYDPLATLPPTAPFCGFTKRAFAVRRFNSSALQCSYKRFRQYNEDLQKSGRESHRIWILKAQGGYNQVGLHMFSLSPQAMGSDESMMEWLHQRVPVGTWVLQEYVMNPMTFRRHKFDMRVWAVVTSLDPLRIHLMDTGIPKVSLWNYSKAAEHVKQECIHTMLPGTLECLIDKRAQLFKPYPAVTTNSYWYDNVYPSGKAFWTKKAWPSVERQLLELVLLARDNILHLDHELKGKGFRYKRIMFLQPDVVVDTNGQATLIEVNTNGYMVGNLHKSFFNVYPQQEGLFRMLGAEGYSDAPRYTPALHEKTRQFCKRKQCSAAAEREIWELVNEDMHSKFGWYRIFPRPREHPFLARVLRAPFFARSLTPLDGLYLDWLSEGWEPKHTHDRNHSVKVSRAAQPPRDGGVSASSITDKLKQAILTKIQDKLLRKLDLKLS